MHGIIENSDPNSRDPFSNPSFHDRIRSGIAFDCCGSS
jgi:hypothetical protein